MKGPEFDSWLFCCQELVTTLDKLLTCVSVVKLLTCRVLQWLSSNGHQPITTGVSWLGMSIDELVNSVETGGRS